MEKNISSEIQLLMTRWNENYEKNLHKIHLVPFVSLGLDFGYEPVRVKMR